MKFNPNSKIIYFERNQQVNNFDEIHSFTNKFISSILLPITVYENEYYCYKVVNSNLMTKELIGSYLAKKISLSTVDYKIGYANENFYVLSKLFYQSGFFYTDFLNYFRITSFFNVNLFQFLFSFIYLNESGVLKKIKNKELVIDLLKLTALDLKMGQVDRHNRNLLLKIDSNKEASLAPVFDYGLSYLSRNLEIYENPAVTIGKGKFSLLSFAHDFPEFREYVYFLYNTSIEDTLKDIECEQDIKFEKDEFDFYIKKDNEYNKILKKIIK